MKIFSSDDWARLASQYPRNLVQLLEGICTSDGSAVFTREELSSRTGAPAEVVEKVLDILTESGFFSSKERAVCPGCGKEVGPEDLDLRQCISCGFSFEHNSPRRQRVFTRLAARSRDVRWVVSVHGMNTRGAWEEDFAWRLSVAYGYSIPVFIYKYGRLLVSPLLQVSQSVYRNRLVLALRERCAEMAPTVYGSRPDVIAHSFGTWLVAEALLSDPQLMIGRLVLAGSIVRPDFDWRPILDSGRVEAILCHRGGRDLWVRLAQYFIPNSGPSGFVGFNDYAAVVDRVEPQFAHSDFFSREHFGDVIAGTWGPFLTSASPGSRTPSPVGGRVWRPTPWRRLTQVVKCGVLLVIVAVVVVMAYIFALGLRQVAT